MFPESPSWQCPPTPLESLCLETGEVHLWRISLDLEPERLEQLAAHLDTQEERRARRFLQRRHRQRFRAGRGALREIVAAYLGAQAGDLRFDYGPQGKPHLGGDPPPLSFNLAHSHGVALCAVCREGEVGVDIERLRPIEQAQGIAESFFSLRESRFLAALEGTGEHTATFFHLWTCKEAYLKACGKGLSDPLREVEVSLPTHAEPCYEGIGGTDAATWTLRTFVPREEFLGAVAVERPVESFRFWEAR